MIKKGVVLVIISLQLFGMGKASAYSTCTYTEREFEGYSTFYRMPRRVLFNGYPPSVFEGRKLMNVKACENGIYMGVYN